VCAHHSRSADDLCTSEADVQATGRIDCCGGIVLKNSIAGRLGVLPLIAFVAVDEARGASDGHDCRLNGDQLGQFPQVLGGGGEEELVVGAAGA
jgi:hypothetical protein